jgi:hypothetical protein
MDVSFEADQSSTDSKGEKRDACVVVVTCRSRKTLQRAGKREVESMMMQDGV